jgi:hypothetical protein
VPKLVLLAYKDTSAGAKILANTLSLDRVLVQGPLPASRDSTYVLNWGRGDQPAFRREIMGWINRPDAVMNAIDKLASFKLMRDHGVPCVEFTTSKEAALRWSKAGQTVVCRQELQGFEGRGIFIARTPAEIVDAPLYTKYKQKFSEFRVHVMRDQAFYSNLKSKAREPKPDATPDPLVRSGPNGWIFVHMDKLPPKPVVDASIAAVRALGLDFGGVDIGESEDGSVAVYEVNTAPELGPNTVRYYADAFKRHYGNYKNNENIPLRDF